MQKFINRTTLYGFHTFVLVCINDLLTYKNVACSIDHRVIVNTINKKSKATNNAEFRVLDETLSFRGVTWVANGGFTIVDNFNKKMLQIIGQSSRHIDLQCHLYFILFRMIMEQEHSDVLLVRIIVVLIFGYLMASGVFIDEILFAKYNEN